MTRKNERAARLQEWILVEAYKNGLARQGEVCGPRGPGSDGSEQYFVCRHDVYQRFFNLPIDAFLQGAGNIVAFRRHVRLRLRCTAILCESVKQLVRDGLIHFPRRASTKKSQDNPFWTYATLICLTPMGVRKAESLMSASPEPAPAVSPVGEWSAGPPLKPGNAVSLPAS